MTRWLCAWVPLLSVAFASAAESHDAACMLQSQRSAASNSGQSKSELTPQQLREEQADMEQYERVVAKLEEQNRRNQELIEELSFARHNRSAARKSKDPKLQENSTRSHVKIAVAEPAEEKVENMVDKEEKVESVEDTADQELEDTDKDAAELEGKDTVDEAAEPAEENSVEDTAEQFGETPAEETLEPKVETAVEETTEPEVEGDVKDAAEQKVESADEETAEPAESLLPSADEQKATAEAIEEEVIKDAPESSEQEVESAEEEPTQQMEDLVKTPEEQKAAAEEVEDRHAAVQELESADEETAEQAENSVEDAEEQEAPAEQVKKILKDPVPKKVESADEEAEEQKAIAEQVKKIVKDAELPKVESADEDAEEQKATAEKVKKIVVDAAPPKVESAEEDPLESLESKVKHAVGELVATKVEEETQLFCEFGTTTLDFKSFSHGTQITPNIVPGVTITGNRRKQGGNNPCTGPLMILNNKENGATNDNDLKTCENCALLIYSEDGDNQIVDDCAERPGPKFEFNFAEVKDIKNILLWDQDDGQSSTKIQLFNENDVLILEKTVPQMPSLNGKGTTVDLRTKGVKKLKVLMAGSGAIVQLKQCDEIGGEGGDPHIHTLDGKKFDLYENGTFSLFHYSGRETKFLSSDKAAGKAVAKKGQIDWQLFGHYGGPGWTAQGLLLVDKSNGEFRSALEITAKDCQWRRKTSLKGNWSNVGENASISLISGGDYVGGFEFHNEKHISLQMNTLHGLTESMKLHTVCKHGGINVRVQMPEIAESRFLKGQIEVGNGRKQNKYPVDKKWTALGGSDYANRYFKELPTQQFSLLSPCTDAEKAKAEKICVKHLGEKLKNAKGSKGDIFKDCVFDVCRGGEDFAIAAKEMLEKEK